MNILISACLLGYKVRYDAKIKQYDLSKLHSFNLIFVCPEVDGGLSTPRLASEIQVDGSVITEDGTDVSTYFENGAKKALELVSEYNIKVAIMKSKSPSCSNKMVYDGSFTGTLTKGIGLTVALLVEKGVKVFDETQIEEALTYIKSYEV